MEERKWRSEDIEDEESGLNLRIRIPSASVVFYPQMINSSSGRFIMDQLFQRFLSIFYRLKINRVQPKFRFEIKISP